MPRRRRRRRRLSVYLSKASNPYFIGLVMVGFGLIAYWVIVRAIT